ncbi:MAG: acyl-CoA dehydrogenase C-terminal domain-containing protein [Proteobacteria bacterium]|nr:acyl-CoA dehydrogenase C-terminal domain-containing protein [Pseudomonadota bacterium]
MPIYKAPVEDTLFVLYDVLKMDGYGNLPGFADAPRDLVEAVLGEGARICEEVIQPLNVVGDTVGCKRNDDGSVTTPPGFKEAYKQYREGGWMALSFDPAYGGQGLPLTLNAAIGEYLSSSNLAWGMYPGLTQGAMAALYVHANDEIKQTYLPKMATGEWTGTMNLTEPHCGTDLGLLRSKAVPNGDGSYSITGQKIFISAGEHDMSDNIVHLVLARIEGAPAGTKGISLFVVPKFLPKADGTAGERNPLSCGKIEEKMGIHGNSTCVMNYDGAKGWLVGEANKGLNAMFVMMNEARMSVGIQGLSQSEAAYQNAVAYAKDRLQGRSLSGPKAPDKPADPIIVHPDVRRTLMTIRAINEAGRALMLWTALQADISHRSEDAAEKQKAEDHMGLMTPIVKGVLTDLGFDNAVKAQQMYGGHGYINEWGMGQFVRDARITMIYEGANGIQALDLVGRKLGANGGRAIMTFFNEVGTFCAQNKDDAALGPMIGALSKGLKDLQAATMWFMQNAMAKPDNAGAGSTPYMHLFGLVAMGYMWARMARTAQEKLAEGADERMTAKLATARFFFEQLMPESGAHLARVTAGADSMMALPAEAF